MDNFQSKFNFYGDDEDDMPPPSSLFSDGDEGDEGDKYATVAQGLEMPVFRSVEALSMGPEHATTEASFWNNFSEDNIDAESVFPSGMDAMGSKLFENMLQKGPVTTKNDSDLFHINAALSSMGDKSGEVDEPLEEEPLHVEKFSSFLSDSQAPDLLDALERALELTGVDEAERVSTYRFQAKATTTTSNADDQDTPCCFYARIYSSRQEAGKLIVEFQRRSGCTVLFNALYAKAMELMNEHVDHPYATTTTTKATPTSTTATTATFPSPAAVGTTGRLARTDSSSWRRFTHSHPCTPLCGCTGREEGKGMSSSDLAAEFTELKVVL